LRKRLAFVAGNDGEGQQRVSRISSGPSLDSGEGICGCCGWGDRRSGDNLRPVAAGLLNGCSFAMSSYSFLCMTTFLRTLRSSGRMRGEMFQH
jgi:hypothetical protein